MRVICPHCKKSVVVEKEETVVCPECNESFNLEEGRILIQRTHQYLMNLGYRELNQLGNYEKAAEYFDKAAAITPNDMETLVGRSLAYLYKATFLESNYKKVVDFFDACDIVLDGPNSLTLLSFFEDALNQVQIYFDVTDYRLFKEGKIISSEYKEPYSKGLNEMKEFLSFINETLDIVTKEEADIYKDNNFAERINKFIDMANERLNKEYETISEPYSLETINICEIKNNFKIDTKKFLVASVIFGILAIILVVLGIILKKSYLTYIAIAPAVLCLLVIGVEIYLNKKSN